MAARHRLSARARAVACAALVAFVSATCSSEAPTITAGPTTAPTVDATVETAPPTQDEPVAPPELGPTAVGVATRLPVIDVEWTTAELDLPETASGTWLSRVVLDGDAITAFGFAWDADSRQTVHTFRSTSDTDWTHSATQLPSGQAMNDIVRTGGRIVGIGNSWGEAGSEPLLWFADDDGGWDTVDLATAGLDLTDTYLVSVAASGAGIVVGASREHYEATANLAFETDGYRFEQNDRDGTYVLYDVATGRIVSSGEVGDLFPSSDEGQIIRDGDSGVVLTVVPWDVWSQMFPHGSPLPIPADIDPLGPTTEPIEWDGYLIVVDEVNGWFEVSDAATGLIVTSGPLDDLFRGPGPTFVDVATGEVVLEFSWEEWDQHISDAYFASEALHVPHVSEQMILYSPDGLQWSEQILSTDENTHLESVVSVGDRFVASLVEHFGFGSARRAHVSADGVSWTEETVEYVDSLGRVVADDSGAVALSFRDAGTEFVTSEDGLAWTTDLSVVPQDAERTLWLSQVAIGDGGLAALATLDPPELARVLTITVGSRTARFGIDGSAVEITDDTTGEVLLQLGWDEWSQAIEAGTPTYTTYADEATTFWSADGTEVMTITDDEAYQGFDEQSRRYEAGIDHVLFVKRDGQWHEAALPDVDGASPDQLALGTDTVVAGLARYTGGFEEPEPTLPPRLELLIGRLPEL